MFYILEKELKKKNITREKLSCELGLSISTVSTKLTGKSQFCLDEIKKIKSLLNYEGTIDELFKTD